MGDVSNKTIVTLLAVAVVITIAGTAMSVVKLNDLSGTPTAAVAFAPKSGTASITLSATVSVLLSDGAISFGSGYVNTSYQNATLDSGNHGNLTNQPWLNTRWVNTTAPNTTADPMVIVNNGTVAVEVNISSVSTTAEGWLCSSGCASSVARVMVKSNDSEAGSCVAGAQTTYRNWIDHDTANGTGTFGAFQLCTQLDQDDNSDEINMYLNVTVPNDATTGSPSLTIKILATDFSA